MASCVSLRCGINKEKSKNLVHSQCCDERLPLCFHPAGLTFMRAGGRIDVGTSSN